MEAKKLTAHQVDFLKSEKKFTLLAGGIGSGKSFVGSYYVLKKISQEPTAKGLIGANTYRQLHNSTLAALFREFDDLNVPFTYNQNKGILKVYDTEIICASMENYDVLRGIEIGWFWLDEVRDTKHEAFLVLMGRLRDKAAKKLEGRLTSSPSGFNWLYDYFVNADPDGNFSLIEATSLDNPFLPDGYTDSLKDAYDEKVYQQEVLAKFMNLTTGRIYYAFDRNKNIQPVEFNEKYPIWVGMDFNVNPMTAVLCQNYKKTLWAFDEIYLMSSDTKEMGETILERYGTDDNGNKRLIYVVPDSTGKRRQTSSAGFSDHQILRDLGLEVVSSGNPFRLDRYNTVNNLLEKKRIIMDPKCVKLRRDCEQVVYKEGSTYPDTSKDLTLTHISDAMGYLAWYSYPILKPAGGAELIERY